MHWALLLQNFRALTFRRRGIQSKYKKLFLDSERSEECNFFYFRKKTESLA